MIYPVEEHFKYVVAHKKRNFGNGRAVRNYFEQTLINQANRLVESDKLTDGMLKRIKVADLPKKDIIDNRNGFGLN